MADFVSKKRSDTKCCCKNIKNNLMQAIYYWNALGNA